MIDLLSDPEARGTEAVMLWRGAEGGPCADYGILVRNWTGSYNVVFRHNGLCAGEGAYLPPVVLEMDGREITRGARWDAAVTSALKRLEQERGKSWPYPLQTA